MVPMAPEPGEATPSGDQGVQRLSPEAAWGMRALIMVLMFLLRGLGGGSAVGAAAPPAPADDAPSAPPPSDAEQAQRAARVAKGAAPVSSGETTPAAATVGATDELAAANRRRAMYASALTAAGTVAWMAGRRSGRRR